MGLKYAEGYPDTLAHGQPASAGGAFMAAVSIREHKRAFKIDHCIQGVVSRYRVEDEHAEVQILSMIPKSSKFRDISPDVIDLCSPVRVRVRLSREVARGEKMLYSGTDLESYITEYTFVNEDNKCFSRGERA